MKQQLSADEARAQAAELFRKARVKREKEEAETARLREREVWGNNAAGLAMFRVWTPPLRLSCNISLLVPAAVRIKALLCLDLSLCVQAARLCPPSWSCPHINVRHSEKVSGLASGNCHLRTSQIGGTARAYCFQLCMHAAAAVARDSLGLGLFSLSVEPFCCNMCY